MIERIPLEQLKVGMNVVVSYPLYYGWHQSTGLVSYKSYIISRITPKKTKVICGDKEFFTKDTVFYFPCEEMYVENRRVAAFVKIQKFVREIETTSPGKFIGNVEEMEKAVRVADTFLSFRKKV